MKDIDDLNPLWQQVVCALTGAAPERVIPANRGRPGPAGTELSASYQLIPVRAYGCPVFDTVDVPPVEPVIPTLEPWTDYGVTMKTTMVFQLSVNVFNDGAATAAMKIPGGNFRPDIALILRRNKVGWFDTSQPRDLTTQQQDGGVQSRYQCDLTLYAEVETTYAVMRTAGFSFEVSDGLTQTKLQSGQYNGS